MRPCPIPSVMDPPERSLSLPPEVMYEKRTEPGGSASQHSVRPSETSLRYRVTPARVPPVPVEQVKPSSWPLSCAHISGPVVSI